LYEKLLPWIKHPNVGAYIADEDPACTNCGSEDIKRRGYEVLNTGRYQKFQCASCGKWMRGKSAVSTTEMRAI